MYFKRICLLIIILFCFILLFGCLSNADLNMQKGRESFKRGDYSTAIKYFDNITQKYPNYKIAWFEKGWAYYRLGDYESARAAYNHLIEIDSNEASCGGGDAIKCYDAVESVIEKRII